MSDTVDVLIVGAGPAGCAAAIELARAGHDVLVADRATFPRDKCCGDGLTTLALRHLEHLALDPLTVDGWTWIDRLALRSPAGSTSTVRFPVGGWFAAVAPRRTLDAALVEAARRAGARVAQATTVEAIEGVFGDRVAATLSTGSTVHATFVVAANGAWSPTRRLLGDRVERVRSDWLAFRQYVAWDGPADTIHVAFEPDLLPTYFWSFPLADGAANVGFGLHVGAVARLGALGERWRQLLARDHLARFTEGGVTDRLRAWPIPAHVDRVRLATGRVLYAGDAAAACDALTGEGIGQALETGRHAARSIVEARSCDPAAAGRAHTRRVRASLLADHRLSIAMMRLVADRRLANVGVAAFGWRRSVGALLGRWMFEDFPRHRIVAPSSWSNRRLGAYASAGDVGAAPS